MAKTKKTQNQIQVKQSVSKWNQINYGFNKRQSDIGESMDAPYFKYRETKLGKPRVGVQDPNTGKIIGEMKKKQIAKVVKKTPLKSWRSNNS